MRFFRSKKTSGRTVFPRKTHKISRERMSPNALKVLYRLKKANYAACLVGGGVRDILLNRQPKDFDIATDATPEDVRQLFNNSRMIGRRFRLVHVYFPGEIIEVSTFRGALAENPQEASEENPSMIAADNTYGTIEEDAWRRDFTVNALFYNIADFSVVDFTGGMKDLKNRFIRMIGDPVQRYHEDPIRLLRAIRLAAKLKFKIHPETEAPLKELSHLLQHVPPSRLFDETLKLFFDGFSKLTYDYLNKYDYMDVLFPPTTKSLRNRKNAQDKILIILAMKATDERFVDGRSLNPGFLLSILLWPAVQYILDTEGENFKYFYQALHYAIDQVLKVQNETLRIPKRFTAMMRTVWVLQYQLIRRRGKRVYRTLEHRYFRAAYDFLILRVDAGESHADVVDWWLNFQKDNAQHRKQMVDDLYRARNQGEKK
jgi:poly(A) polymerase